MSKRYGRNQKRKHREEIARLSAALTMESATLAMLRQAHARLQVERDDIVRTIARRVPHSAMIPAEVAEWGKPGPLTIPILCNSHVIYREDEHRHAPISTVRIDLTALRVEIEDNFEQHTKEVHMRLGQYAGRYGISLDALGRREFADNIADQVGHEMAESLRRTLKSESRQHAEATP